MLKDGKRGNRNGQQNRQTRALEARALKRVGSSDLAVMQGSQVLPKRQNKMADIILHRQRDDPADVSHYPVAYIRCKK